MQLMDAGETTAAERLAILAAREQVMCDEWDGAGVTGDECAPDPDGPVDAVLYERITGEAVVV